MISDDIHLGTSIMTPVQGVGYPNPGNFTAVKQKRARTSLVLIIVSFLIPCCCVVYVLFFVFLINIAVPNKASIFFFFLNDMQNNLNPEH